MQNTVTGRKNGSVRGGRPPTKGGTFFFRNFFDVLASGKAEDGARLRAAVTWIQPLDRLGRLALVSGSEVRIGSPRLRIRSEA